MPDLTKSQIRRSLRSARKAHPARELTSLAILDHLRALACFQQAAAIGWYVDAGSEVITRNALRSVLEPGSSETCETNVKEIHAAPFCDGGDLVFYALRKWPDLEIGQFGILSPASSVRDEDNRRVMPEQFDVVLVPAVGFDRQGNRIGQGKGFYDRFLTHVRDDAMKIGLAFDCQVVDSLPHDKHDVPVDYVITESGATIISK